jgi:GNAT superfamily N-acetyltransferase
MIDMKTIFRSATLWDAKRLFELRRESIIALAPQGMSVTQAEAWASNLEVAGMEQKIRVLEVWIAELNDTVAGWGAIHSDHLEGLYTDPEFVGHGIGTEMLGFLEGLMRERGIRAIHAEASSNAEAFYLRRGYEPVGFRSTDGSRLITKQLKISG